LEEKSGCESKERETREKKKKKKKRKEKEFILFGGLRREVGVREEREREKRENNFLAGRWE